MKKETRNENNIYKEKHTQKQEFVLNKKRKET